MSIFNKFGRAFAAALIAASIPNTGTAQEFTKDSPLKVALVLHGALGDKSFFDSAASGMRRAEAELPVTVKIIELGSDRSKWEPGLTDAADSEYDVVIAGSFDMTPYIFKLAPQYPDTKFIDFDDAPDYSSCECSNVLSILYRTSTAGFLAGFAAAKVSKTGVLGTIAGMEFPAVTDFKVGFDQGARYARPDIKILNAVAGTFSDPAKGKEIALAQIGQNADVIFPIASATGIGALQAVKEAGGGKLAVGVDSDQATIFSAGGDDAQAKVILTSVEKKVGESLYLAIKATVDGTQQYGEPVLLGLKEGAVGISKNSYYEALVSPALREQIDELENKISTGEIQVQSDLH
jgi:basic membrane protein A and related proteins